MDDDIDSFDDWLHQRLTSAARDARAVPRRRLLIPDAPSPRGWLRTHRAVAGLLALNAASGAAVLVLGLSLHNAQQPVPGNAPPATAAGQVSGSTALDVSLRGDATQPPSLALAHGSVWIADPETGSVLRVDEHSLQVLATIPVGAPGSATQTAGTTAVASDGSTVWATEPRSGAVVQIDPVGNRVTTTIRVGPAPTALAVAGSTVWVVTSPGGQQRGRLLEIDTARRAVVLSIATGADPDEVSVGGDAVWVVNHGDGTVSRLRVSTGAVSTTAQNGAEYDYGYVGVAADATGAWAVDNNRSVVERLDAATLQPSAAVGLPHRPLGLALAHGVAWVVASGTVTRIDLATGSSESTDIIELAGVVAGDGGVWMLAGDRSGARIVGLTPAAG